jgi:amino acid permease
MFSILNEIEDASPRRTTGVVTASIGTAASTYILVAITGYLTFGDNVIGNIVAGYVPNVASTIGRAAIVVLVMFSYPLQVHPCRASLDAVLRWRPVNRQNQEWTPAASARGSPTRHSLLNNKMPIGRPTVPEMGEVRFAVLTTIIIIMSYIVAMTVSSLDKVLAYVGSTGSTAISFILPGLFYYKISSPDSPHHQRLLKDEEDEEYARSDATVEQGAGVVAKQARSQLLRKCSLGIAIYGICVMIVCLIMNTINIAYGE